MKIRIRLVNDEFIDCTSLQCMTTDWGNALARPDGVVHVRGEAGNPEEAGHDLFIPVRMIVAVETYPMEESGS